jgi:hypothetical protein
VPQEIPSRLDHLPLCTSRGESEAQGPSRVSVRRRSLHRDEEGAALLVLTCCCPCASVGTAHLANVCWMPSGSLDKWIHVAHMYRINRIQACSNDKRVGMGGLTCGMWRCHRLGRDYRGQRAQQLQGGRFKMGRSWLKICIRWNAHTHITRVARSSR